MTQCFAVESEGRAAVIQLLLPDFPQEADLVDLEAAILQSVDETAPSAVVLDFGNIRFVTSRVLGVIISLRKRLLGQGRSLVLVAMDSDVRTVFVISGLTRLMTIRSTVAEALAELEPATRAEPQAVAPAA